MKHDPTKRTLAGILSVLCIAGAIPTGINTNSLCFTTAVTAYADAEQGSVSSASVHEVSTLDEFLTAANSAQDGDTIKLTDSFTVVGNYTINNDKAFTVDFNGNMIYFDGEGNYKVQSYFYINNNDAHITFLDSGYGGGMSVINPCVVRLIMNNSGTVELLSGTYIGGLDTIRTNTNNAHVYIKGGYYDLLKEDDEGPFFRNGNGHYYLTGGYYTERSNMSDTRFDLAEGHEYYETGNEEYPLGIRKTDAIAIKDAEIENISDQEYTGNKIMPNLNITFGTRGLRENEDYTVSYENNLNVGTATAHIHGIGDFCGYITKTFSIKKTPEYSIPQNVKAPFGSTLANAKLPTADNGTWSWENNKTSVGNAGKKTFKAVFTPKDTEHYLTISGIEVPVTVYHTYQKVSAVEPTCTASGNIEYYICSDGKYYTDNKGQNEVSLKDTVLPAKGHTYSEPDWIWSDQTASSSITAKAVFKCQDCRYAETVNAYVTTKVMDPTYISNGKYVYNATVKFGGKTYTATKEITINKLKYTAPAISYEKGDEAVKLTWSKVDGAEKYGVAGYVNGKWVVLAEGEGNSYVIKGLTAGKQYKVAVITKINGQWIKDVSNAITITPKEAPHEYPTIISVDYDQKFHQFRLNWTKIKGAQNYGIAVYMAGRWKIINQNIPADTTSFTSPKLKAGQIYKVVICAKVNGKWDTAELSKRAFNVAVN